MSKIAVIGIVGKTAFMSVRNFHKAGETIETETAHFEYGAKGFNQALAARRMGAEVSFLYPVGDDVFADVFALCEKYGISSFPVKKEGMTSFGCVITNKDGDTRVTVYKGVSLVASDIFAFENEIKTADILLLTNEVSGEANLIAAKLAAKHGTRVILNPAPARETSKELLDMVYLFTPNEYEAEGLDSYPNVIQTLGAKGCFIKSENKIIPSIKVKAVDTTGAGDTFNGVLAAALAEGKTVCDSATLAVRASGISVTKHGVVDSIPYRKDI